MDRAPDLILRRSTCLPTRTAVLFLAGMSLAMSLAMALADDATALPLGRGSGPATNVFQGRGLGVQSPQVEPPSFRSPSVQAPAIRGGEALSGAPVNPSMHSLTGGRLGEIRDKHQQLRQAGAKRPGQYNPNRQRAATNPPKATGFARNGLMRNGLAHRPLPGERGFSGVPPRGETRFVSREMVFHVGGDVSAETVDAAARRLGLTSVGSERLNLTGGTLIRFRINDGRQVADVIGALEREKLGTAQPNYVYRVQQDARTATPPPQTNPGQYAAAKLRLAEAHRIAVGQNVIVAMIDSQVDVSHPDIEGAVLDQYEAVGRSDKPDPHGTGMAGAIVAHQKLLGVAPGAKILAVHAFSPDAQKSAQATSRDILAGIDWAIAKGARVINMSFAGPYDPILQLALKKAHDKGIVLIAAAGNMGPQSPPLYPAADESVMAVTATDETDGLLPQANQGPHIMLAAPGVNILEPAPNATYQMTTGTSVAAAELSGVAALIIERKPDIDSATLESILTSTAKDLGPAGRDNQFGYGLVDPYRALTALDEKIAAGTLKQQPVAGTPTRGRLPQRAAQNAPTSSVVPVTMTSGSTVVAQLAPGPGPTSPRPPPAGALNPPAGGPDAESDGVRDASAKKRAACRQDAVAKGLRGLDLQDMAVICVAEARLACLKQAVAQKVRGPARAEFISGCLGQ